MNKIIICLLFICNIIAFSQQDFVVPITPSKDQELDRIAGYSATLSEFDGSMNAYTKLKAYINVLDARFLDAKGIFSAIIGGIISIEIYRFLVSKKMTIKLPDSVPPAIAKSFEIIIPIAVVGVLFQIINIIIQKKSNFYKIRQTF